ncbi:uncharacterized protein BCR38DRAFT_306178, partial [Pseudomassariella vexata]
LYSITCHCGNASQAVTITHLGDEIALCHKTEERHITGVLCTSYETIDKPEKYDQLRQFTGSDGTRYWCGTCGCHVFLHEDKGGESVWLVPTGTLIGLDTHDEKRTVERMANTYACHNAVKSTVDGGLSSVSIVQSTHGSTSKGAQGDVLHLSCGCKKVQMRITRPNNVSSSCRAKFPDLLMPYHSSDPLAVQNQGHKAWWLRPADSSKPNKYLAGTCACLTCRLTSGFEIQNWAFVPRTNTTLYFDGSKKPIPLDFNSLSVKTSLGTYQSSKGDINAFRHFCLQCGATLFWRDAYRTDVIDVSVGLMDAPEGARAERWLDWCTYRVSFSKDAALGRTGKIAVPAKSLIQGLEEGIK